MNKCYYELDGRNNGFALEIAGHLIKSKTTNRVIKFKSLELAISYVHYVFNSVEPRTYKIWILLKDTKIDFDKVEKHEGYYQYISETEIYFIAPVTKDQVISLGYFCFEDGDRITVTNKEYGKKRSNQLYGYIKESVYDIIKYQYNDPSIESITLDNNGHLCISIKDSTCKIHVCFNNQIMDLNQRRKEAGLRCLPYEKYMDRFLTLYTYITRDISEEIEFKTDLLAYKLRESIIHFIEEKHAESQPRYIEVEFHGLITMEELP